MTDCDLWESASPTMKALALHRMIHENACECSASTAIGVKACRECGKYAPTLNGYLRGVAVEIDPESFKTNWDDVIVNAVLWGLAFVFLVLL